MSWKYMKTPLSWHGYHLTCTKMGHLGAIVAPEPPILAKWQFTLWSPQFDEPDFPVIDIHSSHMFIIFPRSCVSQYLLIRDRLSVVSVANRSRLETARDPQSWHPGCVSLLFLFSVILNWCADGRRYIKEGPSAWYVFKFPLQSKAVLHTANRCKKQLHDDRSWDVLLKYWIIWIKRRGRNAWWVCIVHELPLNTSIL